MDILQAVNIFLKKAQQTGDEIPVAEGDIYAKLGIRDKKSMKDNFEPFRRSKVQPWINAEWDAGNLKSGDLWGVKLVAKPGNVEVQGIIGDSKGPLSEKYFNAVSAAATDSVKGKTFPEFARWFAEIQSI
jgi:hypothetical protein